MKLDRIVVTITFIDEIEPGFNVHLQNGESWAFDEYEERIANRLKVKTIKIDDIKEAK
jgi:hypothetical protein